MTIISLRYILILGLVLMPLHLFSNITSACCVFIMPVPVFRSVLQSRSFSGFMVHEIFIFRFELTALKLMADLDFPFKPTLIESLVGYPSKKQ